MHDALAASGVRIHAFTDVDPRKLGGHRRGLPVWSGAQLHARRNGELVLGTVGTRGVRQRLRAELQGWGWGEGSEFLFVA